MPDGEGTRVTESFHLDTPTRNVAFFLKGLNPLDRTTQNGLARIFNPTFHRRVMSAIDRVAFTLKLRGIYT